MSTGSRNLCPCFSVASSTGLSRWGTLAGFRCASSVPPAARRDCRQRWQDSDWWTSSHTSEKNILMKIKLSFQWEQISFHHPGLQIRVWNRKLLFLFLNQNICCGDSKEPSWWDGSLEHPKHMFKLMGQKIITILRYFFLLDWPYDHPYQFMKAIIQRFRKYCTKKQVRLYKKWHLMSMWHWKLDQCH